MNKNKRDVCAIFGVFFFQSVVLGNWIPRIPDIKENLALSDSQLGLCLLALPLGTILAFVVAPRILAGSGLRNGCRLWLPLWALLFIFPSMVVQISGLFTSLLIAGFAIGLCEVAMNSKADMIERENKQRIMSKCHGFWSLGSMAGALLGAGIAQWNWTVFQHYIVVLPLVAVGGYIVSTALPDDTIGDSLTQEANGRVFRLPSSSIVLLCLMPIGVMMVEGAFIDWSAVFMRQEMFASPMIIGVTYAFFSAITAMVRLSGDYLAARFGDERIVRYSALSASLGIAVFALAPNTAVAFIGASLSGLGVALVFPLAMTAAARRPGKVTDNVAAMSVFAFASFLFSPALIGFISDWMGLRFALLALVPFSVMSVILSREISR